MPTYEYECTKCGHGFEKFQQMTAKPLKTCPKCGKAVRRLIGSGSGIIFKGAGFYATDYRKSKPQEVSECKKDSSACANCDKKPQEKQQPENKPREK